MMGMESRKGTPCLGRGFRLEVRVQEEVQALGWEYGFWDAGGCSGLKGGLR